MATQVFYQTMNNVGIDVTQYSTALATTGGSVTPEYPAQPFLTGTKAFGSDGSEFVYVQASASIGLTDFVTISVAASGGTTGGYMANSITTTNIQSSLVVGIGSTGLVLRQTVTLIPAGAFFWAQTKGQYVPATNSGGVTVQASAAGLASSSTGVVLFTSSVAGVLCSTTVSQSLQVGFVGLICVNSLTVSIPATIVPAGLGATTSNGFTVGPVVNLNNPRPISIIAISGTVVSAAGLGALNLFSF